MSCHCHCSCPPPAPKPPPDTDWLELWSGSEPAPSHWGATEWLVTFLVGAAVVVGLILLGP